MNVELHPIKTNDYKVPPVNLYGFEAARAAEREAVVDCVLNILDRYYLWHLYEDGTYVTVGEEIKAAALALKGGHG